MRLRSAGIVTNEAAPSGECAYQRERMGGRESTCHGMFEKLVEESAAKKEVD